ncbi:ATP-binding protein [Motilimonas pumila]|uniref:histidine kinase n=1 Tax=Motilimonas pumila TaxID=2303987 RepID=A0A418YEE2_9GAMM|nr:ATP-binding protein [Motilimonas pumila]RJG47466.1 HAMP domain-containing protein [Motilimonas pumila]
MSLNSVLGHCRRWAPKSLLTRMLLIFFLSVVLAQGISSIIWVKLLTQQENQVLISNANHIANSAASTANYFKNLPAKFRHIVLDQLRNMGGSRFFVSLNSEKILLNPIAESQQKALVTHTIQDVLKQQLSPNIAIHVDFSHPQELKVLNNNTLLTDLPPSWASYSLLIDNLNPPILVLQLELAEGEWLYLAALMPPPYILDDDDGIPSPQLTTVILSTIFLLLFSYCFFQWQAKPLKRLAVAASDMSIDLDQPPLKEQGALEIVTATRAFNHMQQKMQRYIADRESLFGSISHDLKTPITRLRLRAELLDDDTVIDKFNDDLDELEIMVKGALQTVKDTDIHENITAIDVRKLVHKVCEIYPQHHRIIGHYVAPYRGKPLALQRCLSNLIDNGIKYGERVVITLMDINNDLHITIQDQGPGIPEQDLPRIFDPYVRLHSQEPGFGLGLGIVRNIVHAHCGDITLSNATDGGLLVKIVLPRSPLE